MYIFFKILKINNKPYKNEINLWCKQVTETSTGLE